MNKHTHVRTRWWHTRLQNVKNTEQTDSQALCHVCRYSSVNKKAPEEVGTSHSSSTFLLSLFPISDFFLMSATWKWGLSSWAKAWSQCSWHTYIHTHIRITGRNLTTGKALSQNRQENSGKPGYNLALMEPKRFPPGRWALSYWEKPKDRQRKLHPGKCLCSTLSSLAFYSQMSDYSSTLNLWERGGWCREGDSFHH